MIRVGGTKLYFIFLIMTDQQEKLKAILEKVKETEETLNKINGERIKAAEFLLKLQGSLETFELLGISLPDEEEAPAPEAPAPAPEAPAPAEG